MPRAAKKVRGVYEDPDKPGVWCILYYVEGQRRRERIGTRAMAVAAIEHRRTLIRAGEKLAFTVKKKRYTFAELAEDGLAWARVNKKSWEQDEQHLKYLLPEFKDASADDLETAQFEVFLDELQGEREISGDTINRYRATLQMLYREGKRRGKVKNNPARDIQPREKGKAIERFLSDNEERALVAHLKPLYRTELYFALLTGVRRGEQYRLLWNDVNLGERRALIRDTKNGTDRWVELSSRLCPLLEMLPRTSRFVFPRGEKMTKNRHIKWFEDAVRKTGLEKIRWHDLRHTCASRLIQAGVGIPEVQRILGHKSITMTMRYAHLRREDVVAAVETQVPVTMTEGAVAWRVQ